MKKIIAFQCAAQNHFYVVWFYTFVIQKQAWQNKFYTTNGFDLKIISHVFQINKIIGYRSNLPGAGNETQKRLNMVLYYCQVSQATSKDSANKSQKHIPQIQHLIIILSIKHMELVYESGLVWCANKTLVSFGLFSYSVFLR